jgi:hypothetical protein
MLVVPSDTTMSAATNDPMKKTRRIFISQCLPVNR